MNLAQQLAAANGHPAPVTIAPKWGLLFGLTPPPLPGKVRRPVPHEAYGLCARKGSDAERTALRNRRMGFELAYLREHGPLSARVLADAFGIDAYLVSADMGLLAEQGLVACTKVRATSIWRAQP